MPRLVIEDDGVIDWPKEGEFGTETGVENAVGVLDGVRGCVDRDKESTRPAELLAIEARY